MPKCAYKTRSGEPCKGGAVGPSGGCWNHDPAYELVRKRNASKGGKRGGGGRSNPATFDLQRLQTQFEDIAEKVLDGTMDRSAAAVACQLLNGARAAIQANIKAREAEEFEARLSELERRRGGIR